MITIKNYQEQKENVQWSKMPKAIQENRKDVEEIMEFYDDDNDIKETVDLFLKQINDNTKPVGEIIVAKVPKVDFIEPEKKPAPKNEVNLIAYTKFKGDKKFGAMDMSGGRQVGNLLYATLIPMGNKQKAIDILNKAKDAGEISEFELRVGGTNKVEYSSLKEPKTEKFDLIATNAGGSTVISNKNKEVNRDYETIAHINFNGDIKYFRKNLPKEVTDFCEKHATIHTPFDDKRESNKKPAKTNTKKLTENAKKLGQLLYEYANLSNRMVKVMSGSKNVAETQTYDQLNDQLQKTITEISFLIEGKYSEALEYIKEWVSKTGSLFVFDEKKYLEAAKQAYNIEQKPKATNTPAKTKVAKVIDKTIVDNLSPEFLLIRRFWNIIKSETVHVPFRTVQLLYMAFNKAAVERKVRKTSEAAELFTACNKKIIVLFEEIPNEDKKPYEIEFTDKVLYNKIKDYVSDVAVNPAIPLLKRFIAMQNTKPDIKKAETLLKSMDKVFENAKENRLSPELYKAKKELEDYIKKPSQEIEPTIYGLSVPGICKNRVKCKGIDKTGKLHKGYKFQEHTGNVVKVRKGKLGSPNVCENRVKCTGLSKNGKLLKGYKFQEGTNKVIKVRKTATKTPATKKAPVKKKAVVGLGFSDSIEKIYVNSPIIPITNEPYTPEIVPAPTEQISQPAPEEIQPQVVKNKLMNMQFDSLQMDEGWENFMQNPAKNLKMAIWGAPKNGKTAGSLQLANYLTKFGKVLYNFADQGFNKSTQDLWQMSGLANNAKAEPNDSQTLAELEKEIATGKYTFVFIDMISDYINKEGIKPYEFKERFMKKYPKVSFVLIFEVTKGGNFKGDQGWTHIVDAIVTVEDFLMENRGRYGVGSHIVWEDGLKKFNPKRYQEVMDELHPEQLEFNEVERI